MKEFNSWLWPDHAIGKRESRTLREEHNALLNAHAKLLESTRRGQTIGIHIEGGLVQQVVSETPITYLVIDTDIEGSLEEEICDTPPQLSKALNFDGEAMAKPRSALPSYVAPTAIAELLQLHEKVSAEE